MARTLESAVVQAGGVPAGAAGPSLSGRAVLAARLAACRFSIVARLPSFAAAARCTAALPREGRVYLA